MLSEQHYLLPRDDFEQGRAGKKKKWVNLNMAVYYREKAAISITLEAGKYVVWKCGAAETFKYECPIAMFGADKSSDLISKGS